LIVPSRQPALTNCMGISRSFLPESKALARWLETKRASSARENLEIAANRVSAGSARSAGSAGSAGKGRVRGRTLVLGPWLELGGGATRRGLGGALRGALALVLALFLPHGSGAVRCGVVQCGAGAWVACCVQCVQRKSGGAANVFGRAATTMMMTFQWRRGLSLSAASGGARAQAVRWWSAKGTAPHRTACAHKRRRLLTCLCTGAAVKDGHALTVRPACASAAS
jgi:hypothetical protein